MANENEEIQLKFNRIRQNWPPTLLIECFDEELRMITLKGPGEPDQLKRDSQYRFYGRWVDHVTYGMQFHFTAFIEQQPVDEAGTITYLRRLNGMTKARAARVVKHYKADAIRMLREHPLEVQKRCAMREFTEIKAKQAQEQLIDQQKTEGALLELVQLFAGKNFPGNAAYVCIERFGNDALKQIHENPFILLDIKGVGFALADNLYIELGKDPEAIERQGLCIWHQLRTERDGHTWLARHQARKVLDNRIGAANVRLREATSWAKEEKLIVTRVVRKEGQKAVAWFAEYYNARSEHYAATTVAHMLDDEPDWPSLDELDVSHHQLAELRTSVRRRIGIFGGRPGTGKTYTAARLVARIQKTYPAAPIALCAPTGKAAVRLSDSMSEYDVNLKATTIHRLLEVKVDDQKFFTFVHDEHNPLPHKYIIVDEASMLDTDLFADLMCATRDSCHVLLIGDVEQLPPVGHGAPLRDLIFSGRVPVGRLSQIRRNAGDIVKCCSAIIDEEKLDIPEKLSLPEGNLMIHKQANPLKAAEELTSMLLRVQARGKTDVLWDTQVVVPKNDNGPLSRIELNVRLQEALNPRNAGKEPFWPEDKVVCQKNSWFRVLDENDDLDEDTISAVDTAGRLLVFVANGELGQVVSLHEGKAFVEFSNPTRSVIVPKHEGKDSLALGYAITGHKSQGSEWKVVFVVLDPECGQVGDRSWIYTTISRAREGCILIGQPATLEKMRRVVRLKNRQTFLPEQIEEQRDLLERSRRPQDTIPGSAADNSRPTGAISGSGGHSGAAPVDVPPAQSGQEAGRRIPPREEGARHA